MKLLILTGNALAIGALSWAWFHDQQVPAWVALIWCVAASLHDLENYLDSK